MTTVELDICHLYNDLNTWEELLVFRQAPPLVADGGMLTRYGGYLGNKIPGADQN